MAQAFRNTIFDAFVNAVSGTELNELVAKTIAEQQCSPKDRPLSVDMVHKMGNMLSKADGLVGKLDVIYSYSMHGSMGAILCGDLAYNLVEEFFTQKRMNAGKAARKAAVKQEPRGDGGCPADDNDDVVIVEKDTAVPDARAALKRARVKAETCTTNCYKAGEDLAIAKKKREDLETALAAARTVEADAGVAHSEAMRAEHKALVEVGEARFAFDSAREEQESKRAKH